jgi:ribonuclease P/MRP protein subunit POP7
MHPPIAALRTGASNPKEIYVSASSSYMGTIKRVRSYLTEIEKRSSNRTSKINLLGAGTDREKLDSIAENISSRGKGEAVLVKATGKAIEKALSIALHFQEQDDCVVRLKTGTVSAVDDIVMEGVEDESRIRRTSMLEVVVRLKG